MVSISGKDRVCREGEGEASFGRNPREVVKGRSRTCLIIRRGLDVFSGFRNLM